MSAASSQGAWPSPDKFKYAWGNGAPRISSVKDGAAMVPVLIDFRGGWSWRAVKLLPRRARNTPQPMYRYISWADPFDKWMIGAKNYFEDLPGRLYIGCAVYDWRFWLWEPPLIPDMLVPVYVLRDVTNDVAQEPTEAPCYSGDEGDEDSSSSSSDSEWESSPAATPTTTPFFTSAAATAPADTARDEQGETPSVDNAGSYYGDDFDADYADVYESDDECDVDDHDDVHVADVASDLDEFEGTDFFARQFGDEVEVDGDSEASDSDPSEYEAYENEYDDSDPFGGCGL